MKIDISPIVGGFSQELEFSGSEDFSSYADASGEHPFKNPIDVKVFCKDATECIFVKVEAHAEVFAKCARCAKEIKANISTSFDFPIFFKDGEKSSGEDTGVAINQNSVDISQAILDAVVLEMPIRFLCKEGCKGVCPGCGRNLNTEECTCESKNVDERLKVLEKFLKE